MGVSSNACIACSCFTRLYPLTLALCVTQTVSTHLSCSPTLPGNPRDHEVFQCMLKNLFADSECFPKYPEKELKITGNLFGGLVQNGLLANEWLQMALRQVLEALTQPASKMFLFGLCAIDQFKSRLPEWPHYCERLAPLRHLAQSAPGVYEQVQQVVLQTRRQQAQPVQPVQPAAPVSPENTRTGAILPASNHDYAYLVLERF